MTVADPAEFLTAAALDSRGGGAVDPGRNSQYTGPDQTCRSSAHAWHLYPAVESDQGGRKSSTAHGLRGGR